MRAANPRYFRGETLGSSDYERDKVEGVELLPE
jgi:hypothetical protein